VSSTIASQETREGGLQGEGVSDFIRDLLDEQFFLTVSGRCPIA
jgi:hypothetical protein